ncbi:MAG: HlyD family efflux transporter periplasmic adaptor subunit [Planctomycetota bacterium]
MKKTIRLAAIVLCAISLSIAMAQDIYTNDGPAGVPPTRSSDSTELYNVTVKLVSDAERVISAGESGLLTLVPKEGMEVTEGQLVASTDDTIAIEQQMVAKQQYAAEKVKLDSDIEKRYAEKQYGVRKSSYLDAMAANSKIRNAVSPNQLDMRKFEMEAAELSIEKTFNDRKVTMAAARAKLAEYDLAKAMVDRHYIKSPVNGEVTQVERRVGEWVRPGDPIAKIVRRDKLKVIGYVEQDVVAAPSILKGKQVVVSIPATQDWPAATITTRIYYVKQEVEVDDRFQVWMEIDNVKLRDGRGEEVYGYPAGMQGVRAFLQP